MKIAIIGNPYYPVPPTKYGGTERVICNLIKGLKERGHEPILLAPADSKVDCELIPICKESLPFPVKMSSTYRLAIQQALRNTKKELQKLAPAVDIINSHDFDLKDFQEYPNVMTIHGHIGFENLPYFQERQNQFFISISKNQQAAFPSLKYAGVAYNGLDPVEFPIIKAPENYLCFFGRFDLDKSPHLAIQLAIALGMRIKLAGKTDLQGYDYFNKEIKPYLKHPLVEYLGEINTKEKIDLAGNARLNLHPLLGRREPFGLTVIESAYCGTPTMAINKASMPELIEDGKSGLLVEDFIEGYHRIKEGFSIDREYVAKRARKLFNYQSMTKQYLRAYRRVINEYKSR
ncbi:MAG TPA: glycosyltransferase family 4 protein [Candidatus Saccharimonadales bacterium]|nr:glycosyltransferase family 4 protein [Candidatus Saccharimonadales bacterium]